MLTPESNAADAQRRLGYRSLVALAAATTVVALLLPGLHVLEGVSLRVARNLGHAGSLLRVVAIPQDPAVPTSTFSASLAERSTELDVAVAFAPSGLSGMVTILDPGEAFDVPGAVLARYGGGPAVLVAAEIVDQPAATAALGPQAAGVVLGPFTSSTQFDGRRPSHLLSIGAQPFREGIYLFGLPEGASPDQILAVFEENGMIIVEAAAEPRASFGLLASEALASLYGVLLAIFVALSVTATFLTLAMAAAAQHDRAMAEATIGVSRGELRGLVIRRLLPAAATGVGGGTLVTGLIVTATRSTSLTSVGDQLLVGAGAVAAGAVVSLAACWCASWLAVRRVARAVPC